MGLPSLLVSGRQSVVAPMARRRVVAQPTTQSTLLYLEMQHQEQDQWCWAAVAVSVRKFYDPASTLSQCEEANMERGQASCCTNGSSEECNHWSYLDSALAHAEVHTTAEERQLSFSEVTQQVTTRHPIGVRIEWPDGKGHFVVIDGFIDVNNIQYLTIKDPWYGSSTVRYDTLTSRYQSSGRWTHSYPTER